MLGNGFHLPGEDAVLIDPDRTPQRVAQDGKAAMPGMGAAPRLKPPLVKALPEVLRAHAVERGHPVADNTLGPAAQRHEHQRGLRARADRIEQRAAPRLEIRGAGQVEAVDAGQGGGQGGGVRQLVGDRFGVLLFQIAGQFGQPVGHRQPAQQAVDHVEFVQIVVADVKGGLPGRLQPVENLDLCSLQARDMGLELDPVEIGLGLLAVEDRPQFPLLGGGRDLARDIAVERVARQDDLGAGGIGQDMVPDARVVIVEQPKACDALRLRPDRTQQRPGVGVALGEGHTRKTVGPQLADEARVEQLAMARHAGRRV